MRVVTEIHSGFGAGTWLTLLWALVILLFLIPAARGGGEGERGRVDAGEEAGRRLAPFYEATGDHAGGYGDYRSPLVFADGALVESRDDWTRRRREILALWRRRLGGGSGLVGHPELVRLGSEVRDGYTEYRVRVGTGVAGFDVEGYLLVPAGPGLFPAVLVPFYEPLTSIGRGEHGRGTHDYGLQLVRRGFVTLSIGTPGWTFEKGGDTRELLVRAGEERGRQPLGWLADVAAICGQALADWSEVDPGRIGIIGFSYGGKWAMFASCLHERFACAVWSDPGVVFNEADPNVNYWEPWYLGYEAGARRVPGVPSEANPRTGLYREMVEAGEDLVDLHALMAPRPVLVSGGVQDPPRHWVALNHLVAVNRRLGWERRVALTSRPTHRPTAEALELELAFLEYWLKGGRL